MVYFTINPITGQFDELDSPPSGAVVGPGTSVVGDIATWNNATGTLLADSGIKFSTDGTLASDSDALSPTQKAVKTYVDTHAGSGIVGPGTSTVGDIVLWNNISGTAVSDSGTAISIDGTFSADSDALIPTQKATKTYVDTVASGKISGTTTQFDVIVGAGSNTVGSVGPGSAGQVLQSGGAAANPAYSTASYPSTATATGTILRANGTNWAETTATYPNTTTANQILYSSATSVIGEITTANNSMLVTNGSGVPSFSSSIPSAILTASGLNTTSTATFDSLVLQGITGSATFTSSDNGASQLPNLTLTRNSASPAPADSLGGLRFFGNNSVGASKQYGNIVTTIISETSAAEKAGMLLQTMSAGTLTTQVNLLDTGGQYRGNNTNTAAPAGYIGEVIASYQPTPQALVDATAKNVTSINLTAGNWLISGVVAFKSGTYTITRTIGSISATSATLGANAGQNRIDTPFAPSTTSDWSISIPPISVSLSGASTYYLIAYVNFTVGSPTAYGSISAVRIG